MNTDDYSDVVSTKVLARIEVEGADVTRTFDIKDKYNLTEFGCVADNVSNRRTKIRGLFEIKSPMFHTLLSR